MLHKRYHHIIPSSLSSFFTLERIIINDTNLIVPSTFSHFGTSAPPEGETIDYKGIAGLGGANIYIRPDCASWLFLKGFNTRYRFKIQNCAFASD
jgi:hypothetical protein